MTKLSGNCANLDKLCCAQSCPYTVRWFINWPGSRVDSTISRTTKRLIKATTAIICPFGQNNFLWPAFFYSGSIPRFFNMLYSRSILFFIGHKVSSLMSIWDVEITQSNCFLYSKLVNKGWIGRHLRSVNVESLHLEVVMTTYLNVKYF